MIHWQPGYVYPPVFEPARLPLDLPNAIFLVLVAVVVAALTARRSALGVAALLVCLPFADARYVGLTSLTVPKAAVLGFAIALVWHRPSFALVRDGRVRTIAAAFGAVLVTIALSGIGALHHDAVARELAKWAEYAGTFVLAAVAFADDPDDRPIWRALIAIAFVESAEALLQLLTGAPSGLFVRGHAVPRVAGSLEGPNQFSGWLGLIVPVLFARALTHRDRWLVAALVCAAFADAATLSRSGIAAGVVALIVVAVVVRPPFRLMSRYAVGAALLVALLITIGAAVGLQTRFSTVAETPQRDRLGTRAILWSSALALWKTSPIVGVGAGNYELELGRVGHPDVKTHANSLYLQALAETGAVGLIAVLFLVYASIATFASVRMRRPLVIGVFAANVGIALHQVFDYMWFFPKVGAVWALLLGIGIAEVLAARDDYDPALDAR